MINEKELEYKDTGCKYNTLCRQCYAFPFCRLHELEKCLKWEFDRGSSTRDISEKYNIGIRAIQGQRRNYYAMAKVAV